MNASDTRRGIAKAFSMWSDVSPFSFREVPSDEEADIKIGEKTLEILLVLNSMLQIYMFYGMYKYE